MKAVAVRELKSRLSAYLRDVARGEIVLVTDRGRVVAELRRPSGEMSLAGVDEALERLHAEGVLVPDLPQDPAAYRKTRTRMRHGSQSLMDADRADQ